MENEKTINRSERMMKLSNFDQFLDERILQRGLDYYQNGQVGSLKTADGSHNKARVDGFRGL
jgi:uncharacterized Zn finger protein